jgi:hypothetical protein
LKAARCAIALLFYLIEDRQTMMHALQADSLNLHDEID